MTESARTETNDRRTGQAYVLFATSLLLLITLGSVIQIRSVRIGLAATELLFILLPALLFVHRKRLPIVDALRLRPISPLLAFVSIGVGVTSWGVAAGIFVLAQPILGQSPPVDALAPTTIRDLIWVLLVAALLPGICEETLFRGVIQGLLRRRGPVKAVALTAVLFAVFHVSPWMLLPAFYLGVTFGILVVRTGSTIAAMVAHIANNATAFTVTYFYHDQPDAAAYVLMGGLAIACCLTYPAFWLLTRRSRPEAPILASVPAGVEKRGVFVLRLVLGSFAVFVVTAVTAVLLLIDLHTVSDDSLAPQYERGDQLVIFKSGLVRLDLEAGDVVTYRVNGEAAWETVVRVSADTVWVRSGELEQSLTSKEVTGKVVHVVKAQRDVEASSS